MRSHSKTYLVLFLLFCGASAAFTQPAISKSESDSLWGIWTSDSMPDTVRLKAMDKYAWYGYLFSQPDSARYYAQLQFEFAEKRGLKKQMAIALNTIGTSLSIQGDYKKALEYGLLCLRIHEEIGDLKGSAVAMSNLGIIYNNLGEHETARDYYLRNLEINRQFDDKVELSKSYGNLGVLFMSIGNYAVSMEYYKLCLDIQLELNDKKLLCRTYGNIGNIQYFQGDYVAATKYYQQCMDIANEIGETWVGLRVLHNIGNIHHHDGNYDLAMECFETGLKENNKLGFRKGSAEALQHMGTVYYSKGEFEKAIEFLTQAKDIYTEVGFYSGISVSNTNLGKCYFDLGNYTKALDFANESYRVGVNSDNPHLIRGACRELINMTFRRNDISITATYISVLKNIFYQNIHHNYFSLSESEKAQYFTHLEGDLETYYHFTVTQSDDLPDLADTAYNMAIQLKGLTLKSSTVMRSIIGQSNDTALIAIYDKWLELKEEILDRNAKGIEGSALEAEANEMEKELVKKSNAFSDFDKIKNLDWKQVRDNLNQSECAIEFVHFKSEIDTGSAVIYAALLVKPGFDHPKVIRLCTEADLVKILGTQQGNNLDYVQSVYGSRNSANKALYNHIWRPMENLLEDVKTIYYSPSGLLHKISFATICKDQDLFLADLYNFHQLGSTGRIVNDDSISLSSSDKVFLMGGVHYDDSSASEIGNPKVWNYLPGTHTEAQQIKKYLSKINFDVSLFSASTATEEIFKSQISHCGIAHISTHGFFFPDPEKIRHEMESNASDEGDIAFRGTTNYANWSFVNNKNPLMRSGLVLAGANAVWNRDPLTEGEDGILTAQEVSNLDLSKTKLVVLSACETGLGDIKGSEGVYGLQRAFKMAGVKYIIMSLWQVPDKETAEFMTTFYKNLTKTNDIRKSFNLTQQMMREKYDPYYWAAFVLIE